MCELSTWDPWTHYEEAKLHFVFSRQASANATEWSHTFRMPQSASCLKTQNLYESHLSQIDIQKSDTILTLKSWEKIYISLNQTSKHARQSPSFLPVCMNSHVFITSISNPFKCCIPRRSIKVKIQCYVSSLPRLYMMLREILLKVLTIHLCSFRLMQFPPLVFLWICNTQHKPL